MPLLMLSVPPLRLLSWQLRELYLWAQIPWVGRRGELPWAVLLNLEVFQPVAGSFWLFAGEQLAQSSRQQPIHLFVKLA